AFDCLVTNLAHFTRFSLYLKSGAGWYHIPFTPATTGTWCTIRLPLATATSEGRPNAWSQVDRIRLSGWRAIPDTDGWSIRNLHIEHHPPHAIALAGDANPTILSDIRRLSNEADQLGLRLLALHDTDLDQSPNAPLILLPRGLPKNHRRDTFLAAARTRGIPIIDCAQANGMRRPLDTNDILRLAPILSKPIHQATLRNQSERLREAHEIASIRPANRPEMRAAWCHNPIGLPGKEWGETATLLRLSGFNTLIVNLAWGGWHRLEHFQSISEACRTNGLALHIWKVCWHTWGGKGSEVRRQAAREGRLMRDFKGNELPWLCPSNPTNFASELDQILAIAALKPAGIHLDYIRFPSSETCSCAHCREALGVDLGTDTFRTRRANLITRFVREVSTRLRQQHPSVQLSAAVFESPVSAARSLAQAWDEWCQEGLLDFACPMDYCDHPATFAALVNRQKTYAFGTPLIPGIGLNSSGANPRGATLRAARQIAAARAAGLQGFALFSLAPETETRLPLFATGPLKRPAPLPDIPARSCLPIPPEPTNLPPPILPTNAPQSCPPIPPAQ
ncbi:MAG: hypothetical protein SPK06_03480, partial [Kiritimatiellia bacterium]|nr:hypothetical protein [Kiritimatiellia bacterium]